MLFSPKRSYLCLRYSIPHILMTDLGKNYYLFHLHQNFYIILWKYG